MTQRYEATYGAGAEPKTLIFPAGCFEALPYEVRLMGPWYGCQFIEQDHLKPTYRYEIMKQGYAVIVRAGARANRAA